jgi:putative salt-induced outer membrane protein YdiY
MKRTSSTRRANRVRLALSFTGLIVGTMIGSAETADTTNAPPKNPWETTAAAGVTLTSGNSETLLATLTLDTKRKTAKDEALAGIAGGYGQNKNQDTGNTDKNTEFVNAFGQYNHLFSEKFYAGLRLDGTYDGIAELDYRIRITPLAGYYFIKTPKTTLSAEVGPSAVFEKHSGEDEETYLGLRIGQRFDHKLTETTKIWESVDYVPRVDDWINKYVVTVEVGVDTAINKHWSLRVVFQDIYDSAPTPGRENNDLRLVAGTAYKF